MLQKVFINLSIHDEFYIINLSNNSKHFLLVKYLAILAANQEDQFHDLRKMPLLFYLYDISLHLIRKLLNFLQFLDLLLQIHQEYLCNYLNLTCRRLNKMQLDLCSWSFPKFITWIPLWNIFSVFRISSVYGWSFGFQIHLIPYFV